MEATGKVVADTGKMIMKLTTMMKIVSVETLVKLNYEFPCFKGEEAKL